MDQETREYIDHLTEECAKVRKEFEETYGADKDGVISTMSATIYSLRKQIKSYMTQIGG